MPNSDPIPEADLLSSLTAELAVIVRAGLDRPFFRKDSEADIPNVIAVAKKLVPDNPHGLRRQIAEAVRAAITVIVPASRRAAVAQLFGTDLSKSLDDSNTPLERPKLDGDRRPQVARLLGVHESSYLREPAAYEEPLRREVAENLLSAVKRHHALPPRPSSSTIPDSTVRTLDRFAQDTAALHCAVLASLFVRSLDAELLKGVASERAIYVHGLYRAEYDCADAAFLAYLRWIKTYRFGFGINWRRDQIRSLLGSYLMRQFDALSQTIEHLVGEGVPEDESASVLYCRVYQGVKFSRPVKGKSYASITPIIRHFESRWLPLFTQDKCRPRLERVIRNTGLLICLISDLNDQKELEFLSNPRRITLNRIFSYYVIDDQGSLPEGTPLHDRAKSYFDSARDELVKM